MLIGVPSIDMFIADRHTIEFLICFLPVACLDKGNTGKLNTVEWHLYTRIFQVLLDIRVIFHRYNNLVRYVGEMFLCITV